MTTTKKSVKKTVYTSDLINENDAKINDMLPGHFNLTVTDIYRLGGKLILAYLGNQLELSKELELELLRSETICTIKKGMDAYAPTATIQDV